MTYTKIKKKNLALRKTAVSRSGVFEQDLQDKMDIDWAKFNLRAELITKSAESDVDDLLSKIKPFLQGRKEVAQHIVKTKDYAAREAMKEVYLKHEEEIKAILGMYAGDS